MSVQVRKIESRDIEFLWYLRNRPDVYRLFSTPRPVSWEEHVEWVMPYMLGLKEGDLFVIEFEGTSVGQVRIDYNENEGVMSISVLSDFRGKGIARRALEETFVLVKREARAQLIRAEIHPDNEASVVLFVHCGFVEGDIRESQRQFTLVL